jgi:hypothetical protein
MLEIDFQKIKFWLVIAIIQIASFGLGYYSGTSFDKSVVQDQKLQSNSTINQTVEPEKQVSNTETNSAEECAVKGNISSKSKIYHVKGGSFYDRTDAEMCFKTEKEAEAAGFIKSSR